MLLEAGAVSQLPNGDRRRHGAKLDLHAGEERVRRLVGRLLVPRDEDQLGLGDRVVHRHPDLHAVEPDLEGLARQHGDAVDELQLALEPTAGEAVRLVAGDLAGHLLDEGADALQDDLASGTGGEGGLLDDLPLPVCPGEHVLLEKAVHGSTLSVKEHWNIFIIAQIYKKVNIHL